jgi:hypothetical protein
VKPHKGLFTNSIYFGPDGKGPLLLGNRRIEPRSQGGEGGRRTLPPQLLHIVEQSNVGLERCEPSEQQRLFVLGK